LSNVSWNNLLKCGVTSQLINKRVSNIQTGNPINCEIVYMTDKLLYPYYYERLLKKRLEEQRFNREFFDVTEEEIIKIYEEFNIMNKILNCEELMLMYIKNNDKNYYKKIINKKINVEKIYVEKKNYDSCEKYEDKKIKQTYSFDGRRKRKGYYVNA
jgi:hypothetical protein